MITSVVVPDGKIVYGYGGKKYLSGEIITINQVSSEVIKKLIGEVKKTSTRKRTYKKSNRRKKNFDR